MRRFPFVETEHDPKKADVSGKKHLLFFSAFWILHVCHDIITALQAARLPWGWSREVCLLVLIDGIKRADEGASARVSGLPCGIHA